jgi:hypothetical protein
MGVGVERGRGQRVPEHGRDRRNGKPVRDEQRCGGVAHVVEAEFLRQLCDNEVTLVFTRQVASIERCADARREDEPRFLPVLSGTLPLELLAKVWVYSSRYRLIRFVVKSLMLSRLTPSETRHTFSRWLPRMTFSSPKLVKMVARFSCSARAKSAPSPVPRLPC